MTRQPKGRQRGFRRDAIPLAAVERPGPAHQLLSPATDPQVLIARRRQAVNELVRAEADEALHRRQRDAASNAFLEDE